LKPSLETPFNEEIITNSKAYCVGAQKQKEQANIIIGTPAFSLI
jgi:hypothetical protein